LFTGLIEQVGEVLLLHAIPHGLALSVSSEFKDIAIGESISVDGACLTVSSFRRGEFVADISSETVKRTTLSDLRKGHKVNLERALLASSRVGGHFVQGHVDCVSKVLEIRRKSDFAEFRIALPKGFSAFVVEKGSIAVSGISLTIAKASVRDFEIAVIPETLRKTTLGELKPESKVNLEFDIIAKYIQKAVNKHGA
jgi:riboflavin synthase